MASSSSSSTSSFSSSSTSINVEREIVEDEGWKYGFEEIKSRIYVSREEKKPPKRDDVMECDCKYNAEPGEKTCTDMSCYNYSTYTECTPGFCHKGCGNNRIRKHQWCQMKVKRAGGKGYGVFAEENIPPHYFIGEYVGEVVSIEELNRRKASRGMSTAMAKHLYYMGIDNTEAVDATYKGGILRYINHACRPNAVIEKWRVGNEQRLAIMSLCDIKIGEEISFDYNWDISLDRKKTKCLCNFPECRGFIEKFDANSEIAKNHLALMGKKGRWRYPRENELKSFLQKSKTATSSDRDKNNIEEKNESQGLDSFQGGRKFIGKRLRILDDMNKESVDSTMISYTYLRVLDCSEDGSGRYKVVDEIDYDEIEAAPTSKGKAFLAELRQMPDPTEGMTVDKENEKIPCKIFYKWQIYDEDEDRFGFSKSKKEKITEIPGDDIDGEGSSDLVESNDGERERSNSSSSSRVSSIFKKEIEIPEFAAKFVVGRNGELLTKIMLSTGTKIYQKESTQNEVENIQLQLAAESEESIQSALSRIESSVTMAENVKQRKEQQEKLLEQIKYQTEDQALKQQLEEEKARAIEIEIRERKRKSFPRSDTCYGFNYSSFSESHLNTWLLSHRAQMLIKKAKALVSLTLSENLYTNGDTVNKHSGGKKSRTERTTSFISHLLGDADDTTDILDSSNDSNGNHSNYTSSSSKYKNHKESNYGSSTTTTNKATSNNLKMVKYHSHLLLLHYIAVQGEESYYGLPEVALAAVLLCYKIHYNPRGTAIKDFYHMSYDAKYALPLGTCNLYFYQNEDVHNDDYNNLSRSFSSSSSTSLSNGDDRGGGGGRGFADLFVIDGIESEKDSNNRSFDDVTNQITSRPENSNAVQKKTINLSEEGRQWTNKILTAEAKLIRALRWDLYVLNPFSMLDQIYIGCTLIQEKAMQMPIMSQLRQINEQVILEHSLARAIWLKEKSHICVLALIFTTAVLWCIKYNSNERGGSTAGGRREGGNNGEKGSQNVFNIATGDIKNKLQDALPLSSPDFLRMVEMLFITDNYEQLDLQKNLLDTIWSLLSYESSVSSSQRVLPEWNVSLYDAENIANYANNEQKYLGLNATCSSIHKVIGHYITVLVKATSKKSTTKSFDSNYEASILSSLPLFSTTNFDRQSPPSSKIKFRGYFALSNASSDYVNGYNFESFSDLTEENEASASEGMMMNRGRENAEKKADHSSKHFYITKVPSSKHRSIENKLVTACKFSFGESFAALKELYILQDLHRSTPNQYCPFILLPSDILFDDDKSHSKTIRRESSISSSVSDNSVSKAPSLLSNSSSTTFSRTNSGTNFPLISNFSVNYSNIPTTTTSFSYLSLQPYTTLGNYLRVMRHIVGSPTSKYSNGIPATLTRMLCVDLLRGLAWVHKKNIVFKNWDTSSIYISSCGRVILGGFDEAIYSESAASASASDLNSAKKAFDEEWDDNRRKKKILIAPEVLLGGPISKASDIWSAGCICTHLIIGKPLFDTGTAQKLVDHITRVVGSYDVVYPEAFSSRKSFPYLSELNFNFNKRSYRLEKRIYEVSGNRDGRGTKANIGKDEIEFLSCMLSLRPSARIAVINLIQTSNYCTADKIRSNEEGNKEKIWSDIMNSGFFIKNNTKIDEGLNKAQEVKTFEKTTTAVENFLEFLIGKKRDNYSPRNDTLKQRKLGSTRKEYEDGTTDSSITSSFTHASYSVPISSSKDKTGYMQQTPLPKKSNSPPYRSSVPSVYRKNSFSNDFDGEGSHLDATYRPKSPLLPPTTRYEELDQRKSYSNSNQRTFSQANSNYYGNGNVTFAKSKSKSPQFTFKPDSSTSSSLYDDKSRRNSGEDYFSPQDKKQKMN